MKLLLFAGLAAAALVAVQAVDSHKFRTCAQTGFCKRHRKKVPTTKYKIAASDVKQEATSVSATLRGGPAPLALAINFFVNGVARTRITELNPAHGRWEAPDTINKLASTTYRVLPAGDPKLPAALAAADHANVLAFAYGQDEVNVLVLTLSPLKVDMYAGGVHVITANGDGLFHFEHHRLKDGGTEPPAVAEAKEDKPEEEGKKIVDYDEHGRAIYEDGTTSLDEHQAAEGEEEKDETAGRALQEQEEGGCVDCWEESFSSHTDSKPLGPASVGMDISFPGAANVYGIPEHATQMALKATNGAAGQYDEPYRLYTLDVFEYDLDVPMALYGDIPVMIAHGAGGAQTAAAFWNNPSETFVDVGDSSENPIKSHWISESGIVDLLMLPGPSAAHVFRQWATLTGFTALPPLFSIAYHQCRWNYNDEADVFAVHDKFEELDFPYDVLWLDIEHTDGKRYFTWDQHHFPKPKEMIEKLSAQGRKMVTIVDPHIKRDSGYAVHTEAERLGLYIKNKDGGDFDGWCWPGSSSYLDFTTEKVRDWWATRFNYDHYVGSTPDLYTWNDMNEPSVFNGPEVSMQKDCKNLAGVEHREWHNMYGMYMQQATAEGLIKRNEGANERPFVLSRSFYAGSQKYGAIWTGDNKAEWSHLAISTPMLLTIGISGLPFSGADVGGFFGNPDTELLVRWYQAGAFQPFFRAHAHHDSKRREPWVHGEPTTSMLRNAVLYRYQYLPMMYSIYHETSVSGMPIIRPLWVHYPADAKTFAMDDQFLCGEDLLVKPVVAAGQMHTDVYLPNANKAGEPKTLWYDIADARTYEGGQNLNMPTPLEKMPIFQRGGSVVPKRMRVRRSSTAMANDPYTLAIALDTQGAAQGELYLDDGHSFDHQKGAYRRRRFEWAKGSLVASEAHTGDVKGTYTPAASVTVERIVVWGVQTEPTKVSVTDDKGTRELVFGYDAAKKILGIRKPDCHILSDFKITVV